VLIGASRYGRHSHSGQWLLAVTAGFRFGAKGAQITRNDEATFKELRFNR
jgi:hypothetical protein